MSSLGSREVNGLGPLRKPFGFDRNDFRLDHVVARRTEMSAEHGQPGAMPTVTPEGSPASRSLDGLARLRPRRLPVPFDEVADDRHAMLERGGVTVGLDGAESAPRPARTRFDALQDGFELGHERPPVVHRGETEVSPGLSASPRSIKKARSNTSRAVESTAR